MYLFVLICSFAYRFWFYDEYYFFKAMAYTSTKITTRQNYAIEITWEHQERHVSKTMVVIIQLWQI